MHVRCKMDKSSGFSDFYRYLLGSGHYLRIPGGRWNQGGGKNLIASKLRGGKTWVHGFWGGGKIWVQPPKKDPSSAISNKKFRRWRSNHCWLWTTIQSLSSMLVSLDSYICGLKMTRVWILHLSNIVLLKGEAKLQCTDFEKGHVFGAPTSRGGKISVHRNLKIPPPPPGTRK